MTELKTDEAQRELFEEFSQQPKKPNRFPTLARSPKTILFSTSTEQLLLAGIVAILMLCLAFFLGTLRGKTLAAESHAVAATTPARSLPLMGASRPAQTANRPVVVAQLTTPALASSAPPAPPAPTPAASAQTASVAEKPYTIQLVTHKKKEGAEAEAATLRRTGIQAQIVTRAGYFEICVGQYATREAAKKDLAFFSTRYKDCFLRRR